MIAGSGLCECVLWAREASMEMTEHHPACPKGSLRGAEERGTAPHSNPAEEVWQAIESAPVIGRGLCAKCNPALDACRRIRALVVKP